MLLLKTLQKHCNHPAQTDLDIEDFRERSHRWAAVPRGKTLTLEKKGGGAEEDRKERHCIAQSKTVEAQPKGSALPSCQPPPAKPIAERPQRDVLARCLEDGPLPLELLLRQPLP